MPTLSAIIESRRTNKEKDEKKLETLAEMDDAQKLLMLKEIASIQGYRLVKKPKPKKVQGDDK
jgi:hypothetical protein